MNGGSWSKRGRKPPENILLMTMQSLAHQMHLQADQLNNPKLRKRAEWWLRRTYEPGLENDLRTWLNKTLDRINSKREPRSWKPLTGEITKDPE